MGERHAPKKIFFAGKTAYILGAFRLTTIAGAFKSPEQNFYYGNR